MRCMNCGKTVSADSTVCVYCGSFQLAEDTVMEAYERKRLEQERKTAPAARKRCCSCGRDLPEDSQFCQWCGSASLALQQADTGERQSGAPERKRGGFRILSAKGRLNRLKYFYVLVLYYIGVYIASFGLAYGGLWNYSARIPMAIFLVAIILFLIVVLYISVAKRFHDLNEPGTYVFLLFIPLYNIYLALKLLFSQSVELGNEHGENDGDRHYWQAPLAILTLPILFCVLAVTTAPIPAFTTSTPMDARVTMPPIVSTKEDTKHYYSAEHQVSIDYPNKWVQQDMDGYVFAASNIAGTQMILIESVDYDDISFADYSEADFAQYKKTLADKDSLATNFGIQKEDIVSPSIRCGDFYIKDHRFISVDFVQKVEKTLYQHYYIIGFYDSKIMVIHLFVPDGDTTGSLDNLLDCARTFRFGGDAVPYN